jgi:hypothetical protein
MAIGYRHVDFVLLVELPRTTVVELNKCVGFDAGYIEVLDKKMFT